MYLMLDIMTHPNGYYAQKTFDPWGNLRDSHNMKLRMHFDPDARKNWETGARQLLLRENPLTKTRLVDDPVLAMSSLQRTVVRVQPVHGQKTGGPALPELFETPLPDHRRLQCGTSVELPLLRPDPVFRLSFQSGCGRVGIHRGNRTQHPLPGIAPRSGEWDIKGSSWTAI